MPNTATDLASLFVLGDSISLRYGPTLERALTGVMRYSRKGGLAEAMQNLDMPKGANGGDSAACLAFIQSLAAADFSTDLFLLNCGLHDIKRTPENRGELQVTLDAYGENLRAMLNVLPTIAEKIVWVRTTPVSEKNHNGGARDFDRLMADVIAYNDVADQIMSEAGIAMIDLFSFTSNQGDIDELAPDGVHFADEVPIAQGNFIAGWLAAYVARCG